MIRRLTLVSAFAIALVAAASAAHDPSPPPAGAATYVRNFIKSSGCTPAGTTTTFVLASATELQEQYRGVPSQIWIDLSIFGNNFAPGTFIGAGPFAAGGRFDWQGMTPGVKHFYRVNALFSTGWRNLGQGTFTTPDCSTITRFDCYAGVDSVTLTFNVPPASPIGGSVPVEQVIDLTLSSRRFFGSYFATAGPLPGGGTTFAWQGILFGRQHYWRINARYQGAYNGWSIQRSGSFFTPDCRLLPAGA